MNSKDVLIIIIIALVIFTGTFAVLSIFGFVPEQFKIAQEEPVYQEPSGDDLDLIYYPDRIVIPQIGVDSTVQRPQSQNVSVLDAALTQGAVYYPGSGTINVGNMFIFGHSTNWQVVNNQAYKTFNGLNELKTGDEIQIESGEKTFIYKVKSLNLVDENAAFVDFSKTNRMLTISTCNSFGQKQERWVVEADFDREI